MDTIFESYKASLNESTHTGKSTVRKFFKWYTKNKAWYIDRNSASTLTINGKHADEMGKEKILGIMQQWYNDDESINVKKVASDELTFKIGKDTINVQTM